MGVENDVLQKGEKYHFQEGGGITIVFGLKYKPLFHKLEIARYIIHKTHQYTANIAKIFCLWFRSLTNYLILHNWVSEFLTPLSTLPARPPPSLFPLPAGLQADSPGVTGR